MTRAGAERLLTWWAGRLAPAWTVRIDWDHHPSGTCRADVSWSDDYEDATVTVRPGWLDETGTMPSGDADIEREVDLAHEMLHLTGQPMSLVVKSIGAQLPPGPARALAHDRYEHEDERATERVARLLVGLRYGRGEAV